MGNKNSSDAIHEQYVRELHEKNQTAAEENVKTAAFYPHLNDLRSTFAGQIVLPTDLDYAPARNRAFNQDQRGYPLVIFRPKHTADVSSIVLFLRKHIDIQNSIICVASGCHSSHCMVTGSIVIDLMHVAEAEVDLENRLVHVGGGAYLKVIDKVLEPHNLGVTVGTYPETGVGGLTLAGGYGWLGRQRGWTVDNFIAAEVVLSDGRIVRATEDNEHKDLLWGLRGGGGNFGIVTQFTFKVRELPPYVFGGFITYVAPLTSTAKNIVQNFDKLYQELPLEMTGVLVLPAGAPVVPTAWSYIGEVDAIKKIPQMNKAARLGGWVVAENSVKPLSYHKELQSMLTPHQKSGFVYQTICAIGDIDHELPEKFLDELLAFTRASPSEGVTKAAVLLMTMGGASVTADTNSEKTCFSPVVRRARYFAIVEAYWDGELGPAGKEGARAWARHAHNILSTVKQGEMKYAPDEVRHIEPSDKVYYGDNIEGYNRALLRKLGHVKFTYDPENFFRQNVNIYPLPPQNV